MRHNRRVPEKPVQAVHYNKNQWNRSWPCDRKKDDVEDGWHGRGRERGKQGYRGHAEPARVSRDIMNHRKKTLLVVDDDGILCATLKDSLESDDLNVLIAHTAEECLASCAGNKTDVVLLDQKLPDRDGHTLCPEILSYNDRTKIIFCTAYPSFDNAVIAIRAGAYNYLSKPFELEELRLALRQSLRTIDLERVEQVQNYRNDKEVLENLLIGSSEGMTEVKKMVDAAAEVEAPVLITGETGVGKNLVAQ